MFPELSTKNEEEILNEHIEKSKKGFKALEEITKFHCCYCGLCEAICPINVIKLIDGKPVLIGECNNCRLCYLACPRSFFPFSKIVKNYFGMPEKDYEQRLGKYVDIFSGRSGVEEIFQRGAVGGTTTGLVYYLMKKGFIVAAALTKRRHPDRLFCMHPVPYIATTLEEVMEGAHSKREASPVLTQLKELSKYSKVAIVGVPCHIQAIRKLQVICQDEVLSRKLSTLASVAEKLTKNIQYAISINCFMNFKVGAIDAILKHYNAKEEDLIKFHEDTDKRLYSLIEKEGKNFTWFTGHNFMTKSGREVVEDLVEITPLATFGGCFLCPDFVVSRFADASIGVTAGCVKALEFGYNSVIVRNPELKKVFDDMVQNGEYRRRPILEGHGKNIRVSIERIIPTLDVLGAAEYFKTGNWHIHDWMKQSEQHAYGTGIIGLERLFFAQKIKKKLFFDGPLKEFKKIEAFTPVFY